MSSNGNLGAVCKSSFLLELVSLLGTGLSMGSLKLPHFAVLTIERLRKSPRIFLVLAKRPEQSRESNVYG